MSTPYFRTERTKGEEAGSEHNAYQPTSAVLVCNRADEARVAKVSATPRSCDAELRLPQRHEPAAASTLREARGDDTPSTNSVLER